MINLQFNPTRVTDTALRRAVFAAVDRSQLAKVKFGQINWEEPLTGSLIAMPFQKGYQDAMPTNPGPDAAAKILEAAGYSKTAFSTSTPAKSTRVWAILSWISSLRPFTRRNPTRSS